MTRRLRTLGAGAAMLLAGCAAGPDYVAPQTMVDSSWSAAQPSLNAALPPLGEWWRSLRDPVLDELIAAGLARNHDLRIAAANVREPRALLGQRARDRLPVVTATGSVDRRRLSEAVTPTGTSQYQTLYDTGLDVSWEADLFGNVRRSVEALDADLGAAEAGYRDVLVSVVAEIARTYLDLRGTQFRLEVALRNADNQRQTFELTQALLAGGRGTDLDIARAQAQLESTMASIPPLDTDLAGAVHRIGVLTGAAPARWSDELSAPAALPALPEAIDVGDPAGLLRRRPDIRAAERALAGATARIGVATADLFPQVTVLGSAGVQAMSSADLGDRGNRRWSIGPFLTWPAFDLGRVHDQIDAADARAQAALARYEQTVLVALEEAENAMVAYSRARTRQSRLQIAADASDRAARLAQLRYRNGVDSFLNVLDAESRLLEAEDTLARSATDTALAFVALYKALGGGSGSDHANSLK